MATAAQIAELGKQLGYKSLEPIGETGFEVSYHNTVVREYLTEWQLIGAMIDHAVQWGYEVEMTHVPFDGKKHSISRTANKRRFVIDAINCKSFLDAAVEGFLTLELIG